MRIVFAAVCMGALVLSGCATVPTMTLYIVEIKDKTRLDGDVELCRSYAEKAPADSEGSPTHGLSAGTIGKETGRGGAANLSAGAVATRWWLAPALGAIGGGTAEALEETGVTDLRQQRIFRNCAVEKTHADKSGLVLEPSP